jgi:hypothetical protein
MLNALVANQITNKNSVNTLAATKMYLSSLFKFSFETTNKYPPIKYSNVAKVALDAIKGYRSWIMYWDEKG